MTLGVIDCCSHFVAAHSLGDHAVHGIIVVLFTVVHVFVVEHSLGDHAVHGIIVVLFTVVHVLLQHIH